MDRSELDQLWRRWIEANIGGPAARVETAVLAANNAVDQRKSRDEIIAAVRYAAAAWDKLIDPSKPDSAALQVANAAPQADAPPRLSGWRGEQEHLRHRLEERRLAGGKPAAPQGERIRGRVTGLNQHQELRWPFFSNPRAKPPMIRVLNFQVQRVGPDGNPQPLPPIFVALRGAKLKGSISNGDEVELDASSSKSWGTVRLKEIRNLTSNSVVRTKGWSAYTIFYLVANLVLVTIFLFVVFTILMSISGK
jgi:hypothetical protein